MSTKRGIWAVGLTLSVVRDWCKRTAGRYRRVASGNADESRLVGRENQFAGARVINVSHPLPVDFAGKRIELREFMKVLRIGDRVRVFCDDGVVVAEKISKTQFKLIQTEMMAESVH